MRRAAIALLTPVALWASGCGDDNGDDTRPDAAAVMDAAMDGGDPGGADAGVDAAMNGDAATQNDAATQSDAGEATSFTVTVENRAEVFSYPASGVFDTPEGMSEAGPLPPGESYSFSVGVATHYPGQMDTTRLSFATMFVPSNDLFIGSGDRGIVLFDELGNPRTGDLSEEVEVWDLGSEANEPLGGNEEDSPNQKPHQDADAEDVGEDDPDPDVRLASESYPDVPDADDVVELMVDAELVDRGWVFTVTLTNVSSEDTLEDAAVFDGAVPMSPGVWVIHNQSDMEAGPLFTVGAPDRDEGLEDLAEDGFPARLAAHLAAQTGTTFWASPGVWAVHTEDGPLYAPGPNGLRPGLEALAEDGDPMGLAMSVPEQDGVISSGSIGMMPLVPSGSLSFDLTAVPGDRLSFIAMVVPSNDWVYVFDSAGVALFDDEGTPISGRLTGLEIWDVGTEVDQALGTGLDQVQLQAETDNGAADPNDAVRPVDDDTLPEADSILELTITPRI